MSLDIKLSRLSIVFVILMLSIVSCVRQAHPPIAYLAHKQIKKMHDIKGVVVIDPGHGGKDSGAVGKSGVKEKTLTLDISLRLKKLINQLAPGVKVVLTRQKDEYVSLKKRIDIAQKVQGDLFLSIHINSSDSSESRGFEVYSLDVASDMHAKRLAERENKSFDEEDAGLKFILADLRANSNRKESDLLASGILRGIGEQMKKVVPNIHVSKRGYNQALFYVLFVKSPAVLAELFFVSNPSEEQYLKSPRFREACARGLTLGVLSFLQKKFGENLARVNHKNRR